MAKTIFALGIIGSGLITVPVLAGSSGYALSDVFGWKEGLSKKFRQAKGFYLIIAVSTLVGLWINFANIDPIKALVYTAVINGVIAAPILYIIMRACQRQKYFGKESEWKDIQYYRLAYFYYDECLCSYHVPYVERRLITNYINKTLGECII